MTDTKGLTASEVNSMLGNIPYVIKISDENAYVNADYGDSTKTYKETGVKVFQDYLGQWYSMVGGDEFGGNRPYLTKDDIVRLDGIFRSDFIEYGEIPTPENNE